MISLAKAFISENRLIENDLMRSYDRKHRPVKQESTTISVQVYLMINHIEKVVSVVGFFSQVFCLYSL